MNLTLVLLLVAGLVLLVAGAEVLVRGAARLAATFGIPPLVIGLTVVAFGTSAPETAVSVQAAWNDSGDIAIGNVIGSNIANVLLILGATALVIPLLVSKQLIRIDLPIMLAASVLVYLLGLDGQLSRLEGAILFAGVVAYSAFQVIKGRRDSAAEQANDDEFAEEFGQVSQGRWGWLKDALFIVLGLVMLVGGSQFLVEGAVQLARLWGLSELVIGLTVVAIGTSLPELATSIMAAFKGERDIAVGNIVGSNIFNLLCVLGLASLVAPSPIPVAANALSFDFPVMIAVAFACLPIFFSGYLIKRWEGALFLAFYALYTTYLIMQAANASQLELFQQSMLLFVLPLTALTLAMVSVRAWRQQD
ncbi:calcium/sodium antiporter [Atopomonas sediminilitoris]|uniref:calcium/sodium antiporter n=1 Tax=Atopomonas sediminilitoris TaxID=2919919 RepID=UPI001F4E45EE|nr:calcium/sodium antiporter [Atopomonas sediminilitoris]MCJ8169987.1 calcium/sodium antiporter [Atopomonas sediminilitoris]